MARLHRIDLPGIAQHIVQCGKDRKTCFADDADYLPYRQERGDAALKHECAVHAYVLMTNHVHLLDTPQVPGASSRMMQVIGRRYVGCFRIKQHPAYAALGATGAERHKAYLRLFDEGLSDLEIDALRLATNQQKTWGSERFRLQIEALTKRELEFAHAGDPSSRKNVPDPFFRNLCGRQLRGRLAQKGV